VFRLSDYKQFLAENAEDIARFKATQQSAFEAERERWRETGQLTYQDELESTAPPAEAEIVIPAGRRAVRAGVSGNLWKIQAAPGARAKKGDALFVIESMKMEIAVVAPVDGILEEILCAEGKPVVAGQVMAILRPDA